MSNLDALTTRTRHPLLTPFWLVGHLIVLVVVAAFVMLGFWQLNRHAERARANEEGRRTIAEAPVPLDELLSGAEDIESLRYRRVTVTGAYRPEDEVLIRSRSHPDHGVGYHVVTPLVLSDGTAVLVNRGWVPQAADTPPVGEAAPPAGEVTVTGWVEPTQVRPGVGPADPEEGRLPRMHRVDITRIARQVDYDLAPVYVVAREGAGEGDLPIPVATPTFNEPGPHMSYAIQWFSFAVIGVVGYAFLARRAVRQSRARPSTTS